MSSDLIILNVPGLWNSGPDHWQTHWENEVQGVRRIVQKDWETPDCRDWVAAIEAAVAEAGSSVVLTAHSLGCAAVAHWAARTRLKIRGALLVAPSDIDSPAYPEGPRGFRPMPLGRMPFSTIVVASSDDPYVSMDRARYFARSWGSEFVDIGPAGHINSGSGYGPWPEGRLILMELTGYSIARA